MYRVYGKVLVKESGQGIPNVVVAVFDRDTTAQTPPTTAAPPSSVLPVAGQDIWERIGSVLTDAAGNFELTYEAELFTARDPERRPDLVLGVFAPEDSRGPKDPTPLPQEERLLVFSNVARQDAGYTEAYVLRVTRAQLEHFGIPYGENLVASASPTRLADSILDAWDARDAVRERLRPRIRQEVGKIRKAKEKASSLFAKLSALPATVQDNGLFIHRNATLKDLQRAQKVSIEKGMKTLKEYKGRMYRRISYKRAEAMGLGVINGRVNGDVDIASILPHDGEGQELVRARSLVDACRDRDLLASAFAPPMQEMPSEPAQPPAPESGGVLAEEQLRTLILEQIRELERSCEPGVATRLDALRLQAELDALQLKGGAADAVALHDFNTLQIAFKHVWMEAFDETLRAQAEELYGEAVRLADHLGIEAPIIEAIGSVDEFRDFISNLRGDVQGFAELVPIPFEVTRWFPEVTIAIWSALNPYQQRAIEDDARFLTSESHRDPGAVERAWLPLAREWLKNMLKDMAPGRLTRLEKLILEIGERLAEPHAFHIFAPNSYNFGILSTYRQRWEPLAYQAGDLVATIPLAPGETRKYTQKLTVKKSRSERELEKSLSSHRDESTQTARADTEIVHKASMSTNFKMTAQGSFSVGIASLSGATDFGVNQADESADIKKTFHEAVIRAAHEYSQERQMEVTTTASEDLEMSTSGEISNPNNEITVTYLLYELQRRYRISEHLHKLTPVILVAQDVPAPHEIDEAWLLAKEWILRRVLLDDLFKPALDYLVEGFAGDEASLQVKRANWEAQKANVDKLEVSLELHLKERDEFRDALIAATESTGRAEAEEDSVAKKIAGAVLTGGLTLAFGHDNDARKADLLEAQQKALEMSLNYVEEKVRDFQEKVKSALAALQQATDELTRALEKQSNKRTAVDQLRMHVKENILHYMQAIWAHEPPDQRFFRLYDLDVQWVTEPVGVVHVEGEIVDGHLIIGPGPNRGIEVMLPFPEIPATTRKLVEVADLDNLIGFKGNYLIFPLKEPCYLTRFMMQEYVDDYLGVRDPDPFGTYTTEELLDYIECVYHHKDATEEDRAALRDLLIERLTSPRRDAEEVVVPTGKLFIEALPGEHALLEDFKLLHRAMDVKKVRAEVREAELENLRRAARLLAGEREDPDIEKKVVIQRDGEGIIVAPDA